MTMVKLNTVTQNHLLTTMSNKYLCFLIILLLLLGCGENDDFAGKASIDGTVQTMGGSSYPNGIKIRLNKKTEQVVTALN